MNNDFLGLIYKTPRKLQFSRLYRFYFDLILRLMYRILIFDGIPDSINETFFKLILYTQGKVAFFKDDSGTLRALNCARSDTPDIYYIPSKILITNPRLTRSYNLTPGKECEVVYCAETDLYNINGINGGLFLLIERTATMLADNDLSINVAQKNTRLVNLLAADTQNTYDSMKAVLVKMYAGDPDIIVKSSLIDKLQGVPIIQNQSNKNLVELIELQQYILAHFYELLGLCTHDQMKRERLITAEINDNFDLAQFNIDDIVATITEGLERVNAMFGTEITCKINPIIEEQRKAAANEEQPEPEPEEVTTEPEPDPEPELETEPELGQPEPEPGQPELELGQPEPELGQPEPEPDPEPEPEEVTTEDLNIEVSGDNNTIVIGGDLDATGHNGLHTGEDDAAPVD